MASDFQLTFGALLAHDSDSWQTFRRVLCTETNKMPEREDLGFLEQQSLFKLEEKITTCICSTQNLSAGAKWVAEGSNDGTMGGSTTTMGAK